MKKIVVASDHAGFKLKETLKKHLADLGFKVKDAGTPTEERCDYPQYAAALADLISRKKFKLGILICYSGIGVSIVANRFKGVRAALCLNERMAILARRHNDANVLVLGAGFVAPALAKKIIAAWLKTDFEGGRHRRRVNQIRTIEKGLG